MLRHGRLLLNAQDASSTSFFDYAARVSMPVSTAVHIFKSPVLNHVREPSFICRNGSNHRVPSSSGRPSPTRNKSNSRQKNQDDDPEAQQDHASPFRRGWTIRPAPCAGLSWSDGAGNSSREDRGGCRPEGQGGCPESQGRDPWASAPDPHGPPPLTAPPWRSVASPPPPLLDIGPGPDCPASVSDLMGVIGRSWVLASAAFTTRRV